jgi:hypothetical protein
MNSGLVRVDPNPFAAGLPRSPSARPTNTKRQGQGQWAEEGTVYQIQYRAIFVNSISYLTAIGLLSLQRRHRLRVVEGTKAKAIELAREAGAALARGGFALTDPPDADQRILVTGIDWKKRSPE